MNSKVANIQVARMDNFLGLHTWMELAFKDLVAKIATRGFLHPLILMLLWFHCGWLVYFVVAYPKKVRFKLLFFLKKTLPNPSKVKNVPYFCFFFIITKI